MVQATTDHLGPAVDIQQTVAPQSGEIFGVLRQLKDTFGTALSDLRREEQAYRTSYKGGQTSGAQTTAAEQAWRPTRTHEQVQSDTSPAGTMEDVDDDDQDVESRSRAATIEHLRSCGPEGPKLVDNYLRLMVAPPTRRL